MAIVYVDNGREVSRDKFTSSAVDLDRTLSSSEGRRGIAATISRGSIHFQGHESVSAGVPRHMAREHAEWVAANRIRGVEVTPSGNIRYSDESAKNRYLEARGLADHSSAGSFKPGAPARKPKASNRKSRRGK